MAALLLVAASCGSEATESASPSAAASGRAGFLSERFSDAAFQGNTKAVEEMLELVDVDAVDEGRTHDANARILRGPLHNGSVAMREPSESQSQGCKSSHRVDVRCVGPQTPTRSRSCSPTGAEVNVTDGDEGYTALMFAAAEGHADIVQMLLDQGADPNLRDIDGESALKFATDQNHQGVIAVLQKAAKD